MSKRSEKKARKAERAAQEVDAGRKRSLFGRKRVTLLAILLFGVMFGVAYLTGSREPRLTLRNKTGGPITEIRLTFPGGLAEAPPVPDGGNVTLALRPEKPDEPPPPGLMTLTFRLADGSTSRLVSKPIARGLGAHQIYTAVRLPTGPIQIQQEGADNAPGFNVRDILRRIGLNF